MCKELKLSLSLLIVLQGLILVSADTTLFVPVEDSYLTETRTLDNDQHLSVQGSLEQNFEIPDDYDNKLFLTVIYVADKDGYRAKYVLVKKEEKQFGITLSPSTLKSTAG